MKTRRIKELVKRIQILVPLTIAIFVIWEVLLIITGVNPIILPRPSKIFLALADIIITGRLWGYLRTTIIEWMYGVALSAAVGLPIALLMGISDRAETVLEPYLSAFITLPTAPLLPLLIIWFGLGIHSLAMYVLIFTVFQLIWVVKSGVKDIRNYYVDIAKVFGCSRTQIISMVVLRASLPMIFEALRMSIARGLRGVIVGELLFITTGLGYILYSAGQAFRTDTIFAILFLLLILSIATSAGVGWIGNKLYPWRKGLTI
ncbi:MAG: ABC transporter permease [Candidatus Hodarchaeota archaeon]